MASFNQQQKTSVYVRAPPFGSDAQRSAFCDKLWIYFQKKRVSNDSDVQDVCVLSSDDEALWLKVTFNEPSGVDAALATENHELTIEHETIPLHVQSFFPSPGFTAPPESDSDIEVINWDKLHIQDDESGASAGEAWRAEGRPGRSPSSRHEGNPFDRAADWKSHHAGSHETATYTPLEAEDYVPTCLAYSQAHSPMPPVTAPPSTTPAMAQSFAASQLISGIPSMASPAVPSTAPSVPPPVTFTTHPNSLSTNKMVASAVWDYQTPMNEILSSSQQKTQSQGVSQTSNLGASYNTNAGPDSQLSFTPSHQTPSTVASIWSMTPVAADVEQGLWSDFVPSNPWRYPTTQPPPGFRYPTAGLGRGFSPRGSTGPQHYRMASIQPSQIRGFPLVLPTQFDKSEAPGLLDGNSARDKTAPSARQMGLRDRVPGTAVRTTATSEETSVPVEEEEKQGDKGEEKEGVQLVEVTGFKSTTSEDMLQMYFESPRRSKGGEIETWEMDAKTRTIRIKYSDPSVARAVAEKTHKLEDLNLKVRLVLEAEEEEKQDDHGEEEEGAQLVEVTGFKSTTPEDMLQMYFESPRRSKGGEIETWEMNAKTRTIRIKYSDPSVARAVAEKTHKLEGLNLKVRLILEAEEEEKQDDQAEEDEGVHLVEVTGLKSTTSEEMLRLYFENPRKSKGGKIVTWEMDTRTKTIRIKYSDPSVARAVTEKTHKLKGVNLKVRLILDTEEEKQDDQSGEEEGVQLVEVTGFKPTTSEEMLQMYFESRKSKGGEIETWEMDAKTGAIRIEYSDPSVARAVTGKTHKLEGVNLTVSLIVKRKPRPRPVKKRCLFLRGIPDGCNAEHVELYIENCSGMDEPIVQYGENPGTALCTFKQDIPDLQKVIRKIRSKKLQKAQVTAEVMHESDCILVQGLTNKTSLELIELYFDNKKKSGGGGVREVLPGSAEDQAIVFFEDWRVVADVLSKKGPHKVGSIEVSVEEYHDCLGRLSELDVPSPHTPKPISMQVPQDIMEFIFGAKGKHTKKKLVEELKKVRALLRWPDGDKKTAARLEPLEEDGQPQSSWLNWSQFCNEVLTGFLNRCKSNAVNVPSPLWKEASAKLAKINATQICSVLDDQTHSVQLVGEQQDVDAVAADILVVIKELQAKAASDAQQTKEEIAMPPDKLKLFTQCGIRRKMEKMFPDLKITISPFQGQMGLIVEGTKKKVVEAELWMRRQMDELNSVEFKTGMGKTAFIRDVSDKIHEILGSKDINAACNISPEGKIKIYGSSKNDTSLAKMYIDQEIEEDVIRINGPAVIAVLKSQDGTRLVAGINKKKFVKADINYQSGNIELAGFRNELKETKQHILAFLKDTVKGKGTIRTKRSKVRLITSFHGQELMGFTAKHQRDHVIIQPQMSGRNVGFLVEGNAEGLDAASQFVSQLVARIKEKPYPVSKIGMVQLFRETKGKKFLESVEKELECVIDVIGENENDDEDVEGAEGATASPLQSGATEVLCRVTLRGGCTLRVCKGDLTKQKVDCIVNAANVDLKHIGGLAAAILQAGGQIIQTESDQILKKKGRKLYEAEPVCTSSGSLPCKKVIHIAGPRWPFWKRTTPMLDDQPITHEEHLLFDGVAKCLQLANKLKLQSIAIPAISTGVYGFPPKLAAVQIVNAVVEFSQKVPDTSLTEISLTNHDQATCDVMKQVTMDQLGHLLEEEPSLDVTAGAPGVWMPDDEPAIVPPTFTSSGPNILTTNEGVNITLKKGSITEEKADVIVNTSSNDLKLSVGLVSQAILQAAGPALQQECDTAIAARGKVPSGSFVETGAAAMTNCKKIFHCVIDRYNSNTSEKTLGALVENLVERAEIIEVFSLAIPALGTGNLGYPADVTARVMYEAVAAFSSKHPNGVLKDIRFVVYDKDMKTIKGFEDEIKRLTTVASGGTAPAITQRKLRKSISTSAASDRHSYSQIKKDTAGTLQAKIGPVCLQICQGDLVKETSSAIVNSVGEKLDLQGPVSGALLAKGGNKIKKECDALRKKDATQSVYVTKAGKLQCDFIFHVVTPKTPEEIKIIVTKTLQEAEGKQVKSISFPALGTGPQARQAVGPSASAMLAAIGEFVCREKPRHLLFVRLVIFKPEMLPDFETALRQEEGRSYKKQASLFSRGLGLAKSFLLGAAADDTSDDESQRETILLHICAMDDVIIQRATDKIDRYQDEEFTSEDMPDSLGMIAKMTEEHHAELRNIERKNNVLIEVSKGHAKFFRVQGLTINVKEARFSIQELFTRMQVQETKKQHSEHLTKEVQWKYSTPTGVEDYEAEINVIIEDAYQRKQPSVFLDLEEGRVTIDFSKMQELSRAGALSVNRVDLQQAAKFETPSNWIPMKKGEHFQLVKLAAGTQEYTDVETRFRSSMGTQAPISQIDEILRIQNQGQMMQYHARKAALEARLGRTDIEETLYHGTDEQTCDQINKFGFNRSFCGKNATVHGNGTYFAAEASFSARSIYAKPNASNTKHIYATKVLVGDFTTGAQGMVVPPNKPNNPDQLYDSVVDNVGKPSIYVIFHDAQAYPEHLIKYK
ncbi:protein mono-ADP-ribosyltransferase PARP14-like [Patiria miniata]|uniref:Poly [ADP-ribose] polymerase n=1 Tax=Patiria miniata TaxID=46514 RepID=A0A913Z7H7_PATMI|nr:protein mono-ADP-ribosyltransferase PARP14-like [Patiria miniata]